MNETDGPTVGKVCNQTCRHCHVDAGPERRESMRRDTMQACLDVLEKASIPILDITGGAPEMNPHFRWLVAEARQRRRHIIDRCNLTILLAPGFEDLPGFLADNQVEIVASLPCYLAKNTDAQRGEGVFAKSIEALRRLNDLGYGHEPGRSLTLVYNPIGPTLPPAQSKLEVAYRQELRARYGIVFTRLFTITNMPISRFLDDLLKTNQYDRYLQKLIDAFNPAAVPSVMCRSTLSVGWDGRLYDCDFNQMLELGVNPGLPRTIWDFDAASLNRRLKASWLENGQLVALEKTVTFRSGQRVVIDFTRAEAPAEGVLRPRIAPEPAREAPTQPPDDWNRPLTPPIALEPSQ